MDKNKEQRGLGLRGRVLLEEVVGSFYGLSPFFMANGKTKTKKLQKCGSSVVGGPLWDGESKQKIAGSTPGQPRRFLPPFMPHKERYKYVRSLHMANILPNTGSLQLGRSYTSRLCLISGGSLAPPMQLLPLPALSFHHLLNSFYQFLANLLLRWPSHNSCSSRSHRTTTAAPVAIAQQLLRRLSHPRALLYQFPTVLQNLPPAP